MDQFVCGHILNKFSYLYLHGFASGPSSTKAVFFKEQFSDLGIELHIPDLNQPNFQKMTLTYLLEYVAVKIEELSGPIILWGSSFGGLIATLVAKQDARVRGLVLLAPGFGISKRIPNLLGVDGERLLSERGAVDLYHYAYQKNMTLDAKFFCDLQTYETSEIEIEIATLDFHGREDATVPIEVSRVFQKQNAQYVRLVELDDGHELVQSKEAIWMQAQEFIKTLASKI